MKATLVADGRAEVGGSSLSTHNERLADPLDPFTRAISEISHKRNKTLADHEEIARLEFLGGLYLIPAAETPETVNGNVPAVESWAILRCLQNGAKRHKRGADVLRGIHPTTEWVPLGYKGDEITDPMEMWRDGGYHWRKGVGIKGNRTIRTRPMFHEWRVEVPIEIDPVVFDIDTVAHVWSEAGKFIGLYELRPVYGRFKGIVLDAAGKVVPVRGDES